MDFSLLRELQDVRATSGDEIHLKEFLVNYVKENMSNWDVQPEIVESREIRDCLILKFGNPRTAIFAHMDSIGFHAGYGSDLIKIGGPVTQTGIRLVGSDKDGEIDCEMNVDDEGRVAYVFDREIERGTTLTFKPDWRETDAFVQNCYMDNRLGVFNALKVAESLKDGLIVFSCWEEHSSASIGYLSRFIQENYKVDQALISDITWVTTGVQHGQGVAISIRDSGIARRTWINQIIDLAKESGVPYQLEVESAGGSDGTALAKTAYAWDWAFIGAPEDNVHSPDEKVHKDDIDAMIALYKFLMEKL